MNLPKVTICIGVYNAEKYIKECLDSILLQSYKNIEISIVDDCSTDGSREVVQGWIETHLDIHVVYTQNTENQGPAATFNKAVRQSTGKYICFMDADDFFLTDCLHVKINFLESNTNIQVLYAEGYRYILGNIHRQPIHTHLEWFLDRPIERIREDLLISVPLLLLQGSVMRRAFFEKIDGFDETLLSNDWILNIRIFHKIETLKEVSFDNIPVFGYRIHEQNISKDPEKMFTLFSQVIQKYTLSELQKKAFENIGFLTALNMLRNGRIKDTKKYYHYFCGSFKKRIIYSITKLLPSRILRGEDGVILYIKNLILRFFQ